MELHQPNSASRASRRPPLLDSLLFLLVMSGPPKFRARDMAASLNNEIDWAVMLQLTVWGAAAFWIVVRLYPALILRGRITSFWLPQLLGAALIACLSVSLLYSPGVLLTAFTVFRLLTMMLFAYVFARAYGVESFMRHLFLGCVILTAAIIVSWAVAPDMVMAGGVRLRGELIAPVGAVAVLGLVLALSGVSRWRGVPLLALMTTFVVILAASQTRTAFIAFGAFLVAGWLLRSDAPVKRLLPLSSFALVAIAMADRLHLTQRFIVRDAGSLVNMSDRIPLWQYLTERMLSESPLFGLGYFAASRVYGPQYNPRLGDAHSAFVEVLVGGGILSAVLLVMLFFTLGWYAVRLGALNTGNRYHLAALSLFLTVLLLSITGSEGINAGPVGFTFWSLTALLPILWHEARASGATWSGSRHAVSSLRMDAPHSAFAARARITEEISR